MLNNLISEMESAIKLMLDYPSKNVQIFHHNDTDGISSGAILKKTFEKLNYNYSLYSLEKPYPLVLDKIFQSENNIIIFADFAGKIAPLISKKNNEKNLVLILDHHPAVDSDDKSVINLDPDLFGIKGDRDISASATCYLFSKIINPENIDLANLGILGAIGDGFYIDGKLSGFNRNVLEDALKMNLAEVRQQDNGEEYDIIINNEKYPGNEVADLLDTLGGVGYYENGPSLGVDFCLGKSAFKKVKTIYEKYKKIKESRFHEEMIRLKSGGLNSEKNIQWFDVENRFNPMGIKMIGVFCNTIKNMDFLDSEKFLAGFQIVPDEIPGFGEIDFNQTKISMRVSDYIKDQIHQGKLPGLNTFLPDATERIGGFSDACHSLSAATTVDIGDEKKLIDEMEVILNKVN